ncbi:riboflavin synthase [Salirhabdus salicampi]|uniref:riboflavin synthase n=1 Tax=Salirhabdus salicampi TaxID=476102 RepID=UPI0020C20BD8|nr:riboflavin synthase [Salirhabdus salicampi]MCP8618134.1 riboflavin synthase [Salirhabdus salicampi]
MFTGIIEEVGTIQNMKKSPQSIVMEIGATKVLEDVNIGDSISINGVCLTVTKYTKGSFEVDVMPETVKATSLKELSTGSKVNLERSMAANGRFGGHFVSGHVDGVGEIIGKEEVANAVYYKIKVPESLAKFLLLKGSIAVDGTSLTIFGVEGNVFTISLIPHTYDETVLGSKGKGDTVNIECDMLAKYVENMLTRKQELQNPSNINKTMLEENGFA